MLVFFIVGLLSACAVGPDYEEPQFFTDTELQKALNTSTEKVPLFTPKDFKNDDYYPDYQHI